MATASKIAFDVDYKRIHAWSTKIGRVCYNAPDWAEFADTIFMHDIILMEVFSPNFYQEMSGSKSKERAIITNKMKMALFNARICGELFSWLRFKHGELTTGKFLVAPSSAWTLGFPEDVRHDMAGVTGQDNHDLRECRAMLFFHSRNPGQWQPVQQYYSTYSIPGTKKS